MRGVRLPPSMRLSNKAFRRGLRRLGTPAERTLWAALRNSQVGGLKFRRQHPVGPYVLDFYCHRARLAVEIDGVVHDEPMAAEYDSERTRYLRREGVRVVRFSNADVGTQLDNVVAAILDAAVEAPHPVPLPGGEGTP